MISAKHLYEDLQPKQVEIACFLSQQAAEKSLKGFIQHKGIAVPRTHNLLQLCQIAMDLEASCGEISNACSDLTIYGVTARYPNNMEITEEEAKLAIAKAKEIYDFCYALL